MRKPKKTEGKSLILSQMISPDEFKGLRRASNRGKTIDDESDDRVSDEALEEEEKASNKDKEWGEEEEPFIFATYP